MDEEKNAIIPRAIVNCAFARKSYPCAEKTWKKIVAFVRRKAGRDRKRKPRKTEAMIENFEWEKWMKIM